MRAGSAFWSPSGYYIVAAQLVGSATWYVRVLDFATWKHRLLPFGTEAEAFAEANRWRI